jgi:hypothetical protein
LKRNGWGYQEARGELIVWGLRKEGVAGWSCFAVNSGQMDGFRVPGRLDRLGRNGFIDGGCNGHMDRIVGRFCCVRPPIFLGMNGGRRYQRFQSGSCSIDTKRLYGPLGST